MEKITNALYKHITMEDILRNCYYTEAGWVNMNEEQRMYYFNKMKQWLVNQTKRGSKLREEIETSNINYLANYGILCRLWVDLRDEKVQYCTGQDYRSEIQLVKKIVAGRRV